MQKIILIFFFISSFTLANVTFIPSDVYHEALKIEEELKIIKEYFGITQQKAKIKEIKTVLKPRNVWQMGYLILVKINILRSNHSMPIVTANSMAPVLNLEPNLVFEQMQRVLAELHIFKERVGIKQRIKEPKKVSGKKPIDVFNKLLEILNELDTINEIEVTPSLVFSEVMRIYEDTTIILNTLGIEDNTAPPREIKKDITPKDVLNRVFKLIKEIHRIQKIAKIETINLNNFYKEDVKANDIFILIGMVIAELQPIKAYIGLNYTLTPTAKHYERKTPSDNIKLIGWIIERVKLIDFLSKGEI